MASLLLLAFGAALLFNAPRARYDGRLRGEYTAASCRRGYTAGIGGGTTSTYAYGAYRFSADDLPFLLQLPGKSNATAQAEWAAEWRQEDHACLNAIRRVSAVGVGCLLGGAVLFLMRRRISTAVGRAFLAQVTHADCPISRRRSDTDRQICARQGACRATALLAFASVPDRQFGGTGTGFSSARYEARFPIGSMPH